MKKLIQSIILLKVATYHITPFIVARAGYLSIISSTGIVVVKMSFLRIWYVASIRAFIFFVLSARLFSVSLSHSTKCSWWIASVVASANGTTFQKSNFLGILFFGCLDTVFLVLVLDLQESANAFYFHICNNFEWTHSKIPKNNK